MSDSVVCRVQEVIGTLMGLGLPEELARDLVYKWGAVEHPVAMTLRTDPWLQQLRRSFAEFVKGELPGSTLRTVTCVCPKNLDGLRSGYMADHRRRMPRLWHMSGEHSCAWKLRTDGPASTSFTFTALTRVCPRMILCMRYFRHTMPCVDARIAVEYMGLDIGTFPDADCVTNEDNSLATWLRHAPLDALLEYLEGVSGWSPEEVNLRTRGQRRAGILKLCLRF